MKMKMTYIETEDPKRLAQQMTEDMRNNPNLELQIESMTFLPNTEKRQILACFIKSIFHEEGESS